MKDIEWLPVAMRWLHIFGAVVAVGGAIFLRSVLLPAAQSLPDDLRAGFREQVRRRWAVLVGISILLLFVTGFFNYLVVLRPKHDGQGFYHALMGTKIILAFVVFFFASALAGRSKAFEPLRAAAPTWLGVNILLALLVVAIGGILRYVPTVTPVLSG